MKLKLAYFGTPDFSASFLEKILTDKDLDLEVTLVVTQPDQPVGRKKIITPSPVKILAQKYNIAVATELHTIHYALREVDLSLVYAYGTIIPTNILQLPKNGFWNIHPSLLPRYRGPSPTSYPLILGDKTTGVTLMKMDEEMDHGPIIDQVEYEIPPTIRRPELEEELTNIGYKLFRSVISRALKLKSQGLSAAVDGAKDLLDSSPAERDQNDMEATYTKLFKKEDGFIALSVLKKALKNESLASDEIPSLIRDYLQKNKLDMQEILRFAQNDGGEFSSARIIHNYFRGLTPWPGIWTTIQPPRLRSEAGKPRGLTKRLKITDVLFYNETLLIKKVQLEGKTEVDFQTFEDAYQIFTI